jgi:hypothetical protein
VTVKQSQARQVSESLVVAAYVDVTDNLDIFWPKVESIEDSANLPIPASWPLSWSQISKPPAPNSRRSHRFDEVRVPLIWRSSNFREKS